MNESAARTPKKTTRQPPIGASESPLPPPVWIGSSRSVRWDVHRCSSPSWPGPRPLSRWFHSTIQGPYSSYNAESLPFKLVLPQPHTLHTHTTPPPAHARSPTRTPLPSCSSPPHCRVRLPPHPVRPLTNLGLGARAVAGLQLWVGFMVGSAERAQGQVGGVGIVCADNDNYTDGRGSDCASWARLPTVDAVEV